MIDARGKLDNWLDAALAEYSNAQPSPGFQERVAASVRGQQRRRVWMWSAGCAAAAAVAIVIAAPLILSMPAPPAVMRARIAVPEIQAVVLQPVTDAPQPQPHAQRRQPVESSVRGVPIVAAPITPQEEAVLRLVRNARAKQLAGLVTRPRDLSVEVDPLQFKEVEIPILGREEGQ